MIFILEYVLWFHYLQSNYFLYILLIQEKAKEGRKDESLKVTYSTESTY